MKALSIREPWATLIMRYSKRCENRSWPTSYRGPLVICASKTIDKFSEDDWEHWVWMQGFDADDDLPDLHQLSKEIQPGKALGIVDLIGCDRDRLTHWDDDGQWHFRLARREVFLNPIPVNGRLGIFDINDSVIERARVAPGVHP